MPRQRFKGTTAEPAAPGRIRPRPKTRLASSMPRAREVRFAVAEASCATHTPLDRTAWQHYLQQLNNQYRAEVALVRPTTPYTSTSTPGGPGHVTPAPFPRTATSTSGTAPTGPAARSLTGDWPQVAGQAKSVQDRRVYTRLNLA